MHPDAQGQGLGERMLHHAEATAPHTRPPEVRLYTNEKFTANIAFYAKRDYTIYDRGVVIPGSVIVYMKKSIGEQG